MRASLNVRVDFQRLKRACHSERNEESKIAGTSTVWDKLHLDLTANVIRHILARYC